MKPRKDVYVFWTQQVHPRHFQHLSTLLYLYQWLTVKLHHFYSFWFELSHLWDVPDSEWQDRSHTCSKHLYLCSFRVKKKTAIYHPMINLCLAYNFYWLLAPEQCPSQVEVVQDYYKCDSQLCAAWMWHGMWWVQISTLYMVIDKPSEGSRVQHDTWSVGERENWGNRKRKGVFVVGPSLKLFVLVEWHSWCLCFLPKFLGILGGQWFEPHCLRCFLERRCLNSV